MFTRYIPKQNFHTIHLPHPHQIIAVKQGNGGGVHGDRGGESKAMAML
jgi:hypothetical protein